MKVFVVSLDDATARRQRMQEVMQKAQVPFEFFDAVRGKNITQAQRQQFGLSRDSLLNAAEIGCMLSHVNIWQKMVDDNISVALLAEDDIHVSQSFKSVLDQINVPQDQLALFKLETHMAVMNTHRTPTQTIGKIHIHEIFNCHAGTAAYLLNQRTAAHLLGQVRNMRLAIDSELFDPHRQSIVGVPVFQCVPGVAVQDDALAKFKGIEAEEKTFLHSTIGSDRLDHKLGITKNKKSALKAKIKDIFRPLYLMLYNLFLLPKNQKRLLIKYEDMHLTLK